MDFSNTSLNTVLQRLCIGFARIRNCRFTLKRASNVAHDDRFVPTKLPVTLPSTVRESTPGARQLTPRIGTWERDKFANVCVVCYSKMCVCTARDYTVTLLFCHADPCSEAPRAGSGFSVRGVWAAFIKVLKIHLRNDVCSVL